MRHELNIPTIYSHSIFVDENQMQQMLTKNQMDYFWTIIYLYRQKLLTQKPDGLLQITKNSKKRSKLNPNTIWDDKVVKISYKEIKKVIKAKNDSNHSGIKKFLPILEKLQLRTNLFGKTPDLVGEVVKPVKQITVDTKHIELILTSDFIKPLLVTPEYFKKVALNFMFWLPTYKSKILYLLFKDYDNYHKNFTIDEIVSMVGSIFNNYRVDPIIERINNTTDIIIEKQKSDIYDDVFTYTIQSLLRFVDDAEEIEYYTKQLIQNEVQNRLNNAIATGAVIKNHYAYKESTYDQIVAGDYETFETMALIDLFIRDKKLMFNDKIPEDYTGYSYIAMRIVSDEVQI